jgi:predicted ATPase/DNA-binding SARP family transcriptional activator
VWFGTQPVQITAGKVRGVIAVLALNATHTVVASTILDMLWGDAPPASAANAVQVYASTIRRALGAAGVVEPRRVLRSSTAGYELVVDPQAVDAIRFEQLVAEGTAAFDSGDLWLADHTLTAALDCWREERALADVDDEFVSAIRTRLDELRVIAQQRSVDARLALGATAELVPVLESLVTAHPYREAFWERLMLALYRSGRQRDALQAVQRVRHLLLEDLGISPGPAIAALEAAMLRQDAALAAPPRQRMGRASGSLVFDPESGAVRQQRTIIGLASPPGPLIGRSTELAALAELVRSGSRIITLTGPGGVGKTRLSVALATQSLDSFERVVFVDLATTTDGKDVAPAFAAVLGLSPANDAVAALAEHLAGSRVLAVLDNLEQVRGAPAAVGSLAVRLPSVTLVATSRSPLRLAAEQEYGVRPLAVGDAQALFTMKAHARVDEGGHTDDATLQRICHKLDCLPLALELAAARVRLLALDELDERLDRHGFAALGRGGADSPERHQSLGATIAWSVDLLDDHVRDIYEALGCFHGGARLDALEAVAQPSDAFAVLEALDLLIDASLLPAPDVQGDVPRFRLLETIRQDAAARAGARADAAVLHRRHAEYFATTLARGGRLVEDDLANLRGAVTWLLDQGEAEAATNLAVDGRRVWFDAGALTEMRNMYSRLADLPIRERTRARAVILAECIAYVIGRLHDTAPLKSAIETLRASADFDPIAVNAFCYLGSMALDGGDLAAADDCAAQAVEWARRAEDVDGESIALDFIAYVARSRGDFTRAADVMSSAVEIARGHAAPADLAQRLSSLSIALSAINAEDAAERTAREALLLARTARARPSERDALVALGVAIGKENPLAAVSHLARAAGMSFELGQAGLEELTRLAQALMVAGDLERAALLAGVATARQREAAIDSPECARIRADLEARLDPRNVERGTHLDHLAVLDLVAEVRTTT